MALIIRKEQIGVLDAAAVATFEGNLLKHAQEFFPLHWDVIGRSQLRTVISLAREIAFKYGFVAEREVCLYFSLMLSLGSFFYRDIQLSWATEMLGSPCLSGLRAKLDSLHDRAHQHLNQVNGTGAALLKNALARVDSISVDDVYAIPSALELIFPAKCNAVGKPVIVALIGIARGRCMHYAISDPNSTLLFSACMLLLGQDFDVDPQFPWASTLLSSDLPDALKAHQFAEKTFMQRQLWLA